jgi:hypothetical protein
VLALESSASTRDRTQEATGAIKVTLMYTMSIEDAAELIRMEYAELPGLQLTFWQAQRLWDLPEDLCDRALTLLTRAGYLERTRDGCYRRFDPTSRRSLQVPAS